MKTINLKQYYDLLYKTDTFVEVPDEIAEAIEEEHRADRNSERRLWSHIYSIDISPGLERHLVEYAPSAEDIFLEKETHYEEMDTKALMMERLREALSTLTPTQARRLNARCIEGKKYREIAEAEGISTNLATNTVRDAILKLRKYFIKHDWMEPPKENGICTKKSPPKRNRKKTSAKKS